MSDPSKHCPKCGASFALVGRAHNCNPRPVPATPVPVRAARAATVSCAPVAAVVKKPKRVAVATYQYRDPVKRKAYMRAYMARWRKKR